MVNTAKSYSESKINNALAVAMYKHFPLRNTDAIGLKEWDKFVEEFHKVLDEN